MSRRPDWRKSAGDRQAEVACSADIVGSAGSRLTHPLDSKGNHVACSTIIGKNHAVYLEKACKPGFLQARSIGAAGLPLPRHPVPEQDQSSRDAIVPVCARYCRDQERTGARPNPSYGLAQYEQRNVVQRSNLGECRDQLVRYGEPATGSPLGVLVLVPRRSVIDIAGICVIEQGRKGVDHDQGCVRGRERGRRVHEQREQMGKRWRCTVMEVALHFISRGSGYFWQRATVARRLGDGEQHLVEALGHQGRTRRVCTQLALITRWELPDGQVLTNPDHPMAVTQCIRRCLDAEPASVVAPHVCGRRGLYLPKGRLPNAWRAEHFRHLASHVPARHASAWRAGRGEHAVELREASRHGARTLGMERLEGLRGRHRRQAVYS
jgi:hypothetical protein